MSKNDFGEMINGIATVENANSIREGDGRGMQRRVAGIEKTCHDCLENIFEKIYGKIELIARNTL